MRNVRGIFYIVLSALGFAIMAACVRLCDDFGPAIGCFEKSFFRNFIALLIAACAFVPSLRRRGRRENAPMSAKAWGLIIFRSLVGTVGIFSNFYALSFIPIADAQTLNKTGPFFTVVFAALFLREKVSVRQLTALVTAFLGTLLVVKPGFAGEGTLPLAMGLLGGISAGAAYTSVRALGAMKVSAALIVFVFSAFSTLAAVPFVCFTYVPLTAMQFFTLLGAGLGAAMGQFGLTFAYRHSAPKDIAVYDYSNIIFTAALGYLLFAQISDVFTIIGILVIIFAALLLHLPNTGRKR